MELYKELEDFYDAVAAWTDIKPQFEELGLGDIDRVIAIFDPEAQEGILVTREEDIGPVVMQEGRQEHVFRAVELGGRIRVAREAFQRALDARKVS